MLNYLKSLFQTPRFTEGARVNQLVSPLPMAWTVSDRIDGRVLTQTDHGVLVEWPRSGLRWVKPESLCQQA